MHGVFGASSCKKDDPNGGETPDSTEADFFIDVNFLPKEETNGELVPRLMINFNDEAVMIELRQPSADTAAMETVLFLCPDNEAMLMCGNDRLLVFAAYDVETYTPSDDVLLVTPLNDDALLLTKCVMDWNTNTMTKGDMMVLPIDETSKNLRKRSDDAGETRDFVFNHLVKQFGENFDKVEYFCVVTGIPLAPVFSAYKYTITTGLTNILYSDDSEELYDHTSYPVSMWTAQGAQTVIINHLPLGIRDVVSRGVALLSWFMSGGHGKVDDYEGGNGGTNEFSYPSIWSQSGNVIHASDILNVQPPAYIVNLDVSNITENSAYFKGHLQFTSSITPIAMGYVFKLSGGPEHIVEDMSFQGKTVSGLIKATKYIAYAYAESAGDRVVSPEVSFWTLGFEAYPNSLTFPAEGDTKYFGLSYSHEDITSWEITSQPSWCSITTDDLGLLVVTVGETTETRSGTITITVHSNALGNLTQDILVTQLGENNWDWDGTSWKFSGMVGSLGLECYLTINNVSNNDVMISFVPDIFFGVPENYFCKNYVIDDNGYLVFTATLTMDNGDVWKVQVTFVRTGSNTATANFYEYIPIDGGGTLTGLLQGTMINAKEIKDYKTTNNFKEGFLRPSMIGQ